MNKVFRINPSPCIAVCLLLASASCSDIEQASEADSGIKEGRLPLALKGMPFRNSAEDAAAQLASISIYHFSDKEFLFRTDVEDPYADDLQVLAGATSKLYCVSGVSLSAEAGVTKPDDFAHSIVDFDKENEVCPMFHSAVASLDDAVWSEGKLEVALQRSVARIDFSNEVDADVSVDQVVVLDAPASTYVFPSDAMPSDETVTMTKTFESSFKGSEKGIFQIFESQRPVHVRILGEYKDSPLNIEVTLPAVERNNIYTLQVVNINSRLEGAFSVRNWEEGSGVEASPAIASGIFIDKANSSFPSGVEVDYDTNKVRVPATGVAGMKLAFLSASKVTMAGVEGDVASVEVSANDAVQVEGGYVSSINVDIAPQPNGASSYSVMVHLTDETGKYNFVDIKVPSYHYIETVDIAGSEWMCFNAVSADLENQVFPFEGISVEDMYRMYWWQAMGNFFQYGRQLGYNPWVRNDPNGNSETARDIPWTSPDCMPVPAGYHVASAEEWQSLFPSGTSIPSTYTAGNGEKIKAEIVTLPGYLNGTPSLSANRANLLMRYVRLESLQTGSVLILPICGQKTASWDEYPGSGRLIHNCVCYWIADDRCVWVLQATDGADELTFSQHKDRWNYDGFLPVRAIKNKE